MNNYKFGNYICKLREALGLTQAELAEKLDVSDKAISKWENGQAIPRMETFEKLALSLDTTVEEILSASKDGISRVCFVNNFSSIMQLDVNGQLFCLRDDESKWVELTEDTIIVKITGDLITDDDFEHCTEEEGPEDEKASKTLQKTVDHFMDYILQVDCTYQITAIEPDTVIVIDVDLFELSDKTLMYIDFQIAYPKINLDSDRVELLSAKGKNSKEVIRKYKKAGLFSDLGFGFVLMLLLYPIRGWYFKHLCKPAVLKKNILNAGYHKEKAEKRSRRKFGCLTSLLLILLVLVLDLFVLPVIFVENDKPALLSEDYATITYDDDVYVRIEDLPEYAMPETEPLFDATIWVDVRTEGLSKTDQYLQDDKVMLYEDYKGRKYLWLVEDYANTMTDEKEDYDDFTEHYVYMFDPAD